MINPILFSQLLKELAIVSHFWHQPAKIVCPPSFCALASHNEWEDRNMDARVNTAVDPSTSDKTLVNFCPVTPAFCRRVCAGQTTCWGLPRISSFLSENVANTVMSRYSETGGLIYVVVGRLRRRRVVCASSLILTSSDALDRLSCIANRCHNRSL